ncbi:NUDIX hydrolase [Tropicibacter naphthalenivorans]|uniref:NUDIX domain protein n=1 Tax=Tropicibacter naphthalenivorans TaxID=441103 RepID=A0A0P1GBH4_9RHOB|nr:NUDIX hydrolase [Tropicibacter naphthalenivorans]CUH78783.1 NUDIX domain protein [Tropicibacter naphthalenivorans]SMC81533.1 Predicted NTP pyrophosphohydrolase, NUDIX family [Tropicibacter naphthalenivorans]
MPEIGEQIAALPLRRDDKHHLRVLMVTSRNTGRWLIPRGWEMDGKTPWQAAEIEAMEEAGAKGEISPEVIGTYRYAKILSDGRIIPCVVRVYPMIVHKLKDDWKERKQRSRRWFSLKEAAKRVIEPELADLLLSLQTEANLPTALRKLSTRRV